MPLSAAAIRELDRFDVSLAASREPSFRHPAHYPRLVRVLMHLLRAGEVLAPNDLTAWARTHGWTEDDALVLGDAAIIVGIALDDAGLLP
jgi:hypothetical protein